MKATAATDSAWLTNYAVEPPFTRVKEMLSKECNGLANVVKRYQELKEDGELAITKGRKLTDDQQHAIQCVQETELHHNFLLRVLAALGKDELAYNKAAAARDTNVAKEMQRRMWQSHVDMTVFRDLLSKFHRPVIRNAYIKFQQTLEFPDAFTEDEMRVLSLLWGEMLPNEDGCGNMEQWIKKVKPAMRSAYLTLTQTELPVANIENVNGNVLYNLLCRLRDSTFWSVGDYLNKSANEDEKPTPVEKTSQAKTETNETTAEVIAEGVNSNANSVEIGEVSEDDRDMQELSDMIQTLVAKEQVPAGDIKFGYSSQDSSQASPRHSPVSKRSSAPPSDPEQKPLINNKPNNSSSKARRMRSRNSNKSSEDESRADGTKQPAKNQRPRPPRTNKTKTTAESAASTVNGPSAEHSGSLPKVVEQPEQPTTEVKKEAAPKARRPNTENGPSTRRGPRPNGKPANANGISNPAKTWSNGPPRPQTDNTNGVRNPAQNGNGIPAKTWGNAAPRPQNGNSNGVRYPAQNRVYSSENYTARPKVRAPPPGVCGFTFTSI